MRSRSAWAPRTAKVGLGNYAVPPPVTLGMRERRERTAVHLALRCDDVVPQTACLASPRRFVLGARGDWDVPAEVLGRERFKAPAPRRPLALPDRPAASVGAAVLDAALPRYLLAGPHP